MREQQVVPVADGQRQVGDLVAADDGAERGGLGVEQRRCASTVTVSATPPAASAKSTRPRWPVVEHDLLRGGWKPGAGGFDQVLAGREVDDEPDTVLGRVTAVRRTPGGVAGDGDRGAGHDGVAGIADHAGERGAIDLGERRQRQA